MTHHFYAVNRYLLFAACLVLGGLLSVTPMLTLADGAEPVRLSSATEAYPLGLALEYLEDPTGSYTIETVSQAPLNADFQASEQAFPNFGYTPSVYWFRLALDNQTERESTWWLEIPAPYLDRVQFFSPTDSGFNLAQAGDAMPFAERAVAHRNIVFPLTPPTAEITTYYLRAESSGTLTLPATLWSSAAFASRNYNSLWGFGLYYGALLVILGYSIFTLILFRERKYFYHTAVIVTFLMFQGTTDGLTHQYLWPWASLWSNVVIVIVVGPLLFFIIAFARDFLEIARHTPRIDKILLAFMSLYVFITVLVPFVEYRYIASALVIIVPPTTLVSLFVASVIAWRYRFRPAYSYLIASVMLLPATIIIFLATFDLIPRTALSENINRLVGVWFLAFVGLDFVNQLTNLVEQRTIQLGQANRQLSQLNQQLEDELIAARRIQQELLPASSPNWSDLAVMATSQAAEKVGGDFYTYHRTNKNSLVLAVGDISGKGMSAALLMATSLAHFNALLNRDIRPTDRLIALDEALVPYTHTTNHNCALCYAELKRSAPNGPFTVTVVNAGGIPPYLKRANGSARWLEVSGLPLGIGEAAKWQYHTETLTLAPGDMLIFTSDGVVEATRPEREMFGFERLEAAIIAGPNDDPPAMLTHLQGTLTQFMGHTAPQDDVTMMVVQAPASVSETP